MRPLVLADLVCIIVPLDNLPAASSHCSDLGIMLGFIYFFCFVSLSLRAELMAYSICPEWSTFDLNHAVQEGTILQSEESFHSLVQGMT